MTSKERAQNDYDGKYFAYQICVYEAINTYHVKYRNLACGLLGIFVVTYLLSLVLRCFLMSCFVKIDFTQPEWKSESRFNTWMIAIMALLAGINIYYLIKIAIEGAGANQGQVVAYFSMV